MERALAPRHIYGLIALGVVAVSASAVLVKLSATPPVALAFYRLLVTWLLLLPVVLWREGRSLLAPGLRDVGLAVAAGVFLALHYAVWFASLRLTSVASATVLVTTQPIWVMLIAYLLWRDKTAPAALAGIAVALGGVYLIGAEALQEAGGRLLGDVLAVVAAILVSVYLLIGQRVRRRVSLLVYVFWLYGAAAVVLGIAALLTGVPLTGYGPSEWWIFVALAVGPTLLGHTVFNWALQHVPASVVAVSVLGEPVGATLLALLVLGEVPAPAQVAGGVLILSGILVFLRYQGAGGTPVPADKRAWRRLLGTRRRAVPADVREAWGRRMADHYWSVPQLAAARRVMIYAAMEPEAPTEALARRLWAAGRTVCFPRLVPGRPGQMDVVPADGWDKLVPGPFRGILEPPPDAPAIDPASLDAVVVPGVGFDRTGRRLGQGGGYYDRLLARLPRRVLRVGWGFSVQLVDRLPEEPHDQGMDLVITETGVLWCRKEEADPIQDLPVP